METTSCGDFDYKSCDDDSCNNNNNNNISNNNEVSDSGDYY